MVIGVDMDEVIFPLLENHCIFLNKKYGYNLTPKKFTNYNFWEHYGGSREGAIQDFIEFTATDEFMKSLPIEGSREGASELKKLDNLYIITARTTKIKDKTEEWLNQHFNGIFSGIYFCNTFSNGQYKKLTKREICKSQDISLLAEDHEEYALDVSKDIPVILIDRPWNQNVPIHAPNIYRVQDLRDAATIAKALFKKNSKK